MADPTTTGGVRCHNPDACCAGQKPCPSPAACGVPAPAQKEPSAQWKFNALYADTEVRSTADDRLLAVVHAGPEKARIVSLLKVAPQSKALPSDAEIEAFREAFDWDGWTCAKAAQRAFARAVLARWSAPAAVSAPSVSEDATRLDFIGMHRVALIPEFEGGWDAQVYEEDAEPSVIVGGTTVRAAIDAAMAAAPQASAVEGGAA